MCNIKKSFWRCVMDALSTVILRLCRVHITCSGFDKLPSQGSFLLVSNHVSLFDPVTLIHLTKNRNMLYVSKPENFKLPVAGFLMRKCGFLAIDRDNPRNAIQTIYAAAERMKKENCPLTIYPEGTRNKTPQNGLLPFHNGVFKIAKRAGAAVIVLAVKGTEKIKKNAPWRKTYVTVSVVDVLDEEFVQQNNDRIIGERVREKMEERLYSCKTAVQETA